MKPLFIFFFALIALVGIVEGATVVLNSPVTLCGINNTWANDDLTINTTVSVCAWAGTWNETPATNCVADCGFLNLYAANLTITSNGVINASGKGWRGGNQAKGEGNGASAGNNNIGGNVGGAGYGGNGGNGQGGGSFDYNGGSAYGSITNVTNLGSGSGGAPSSSNGGNGGGYVVLNITNKLNISGSVDVSGSNGISGSSSYSGGGGSGGGIYLVTHLLSGNGNLYLRGGRPIDVSYDSGGGGGGRFRADYDLNLSCLASVNIAGGTAYGSAISGSDGSIYFSKSFSVSTSVTSPTTASPASVSAGDNVTITFDVQDWGVNLTSGVSVQNVSVGGIQTVVINHTVPYIGDIAQLTAGFTGTAGTTQTIPFTAFPDVNYAALASQSDDDDSAYAREFSTKSTTSVVFNMEDDTGSAESTNIEYLISAFGEFTNYDLSKQIFLMKCGNVTGASTSGNPVTFTTAMPSDDYVAICNSEIDTESVDVVATSKTSAGFTAYANDDAGGTEAVSSIDWCAFSKGDYTFSNIYIRSNSSTSSSGGSIYIPFGTDMPDSNYAVLASETTGTAGALGSVQIDSKNTSGFMITIQDDVGTVVTRPFDYIAISIGNYSLQGNKTEEEPQLAYTPSVGWQANITMPSGLTGLQDLFLNISYSGIYANTTALSVFDFGGVTDSCTYTSGNWVITDNCTLTSNVNVDGYLNISAQGSLNWSSYSVNATKYIIYPRADRWSWLFYDIRSWIIRGV